MAESESADIGIDMNFEVNGESYFLALLPQSGDVALFSPTRGGIRRLPVSTDEGPVELFAVGLADEDGDGTAGVH